MQGFCKRLVLTAVGLVLAGVGLAQLGVPREECFPVERLPADLRVEAETMLLRALDREALFTVVGGLKPMSSGFATGRIEAANPDVAALRRLQRITAVLRSGEEITAGVQVFAMELEGQRTYDAVLFHREAFAYAVRREQRLFGQFGVTPLTAPVEALLAFDSSRSIDRFRAYGHLFGYPEYAIEFFAAAAESQRATGTFVERDFFSIPTFSLPTNGYVYAVPKGAARRAEDDALRARAEPILEEYRRRREAYIGPGKPGVVALLRDWFDDGTGRCSPRTAMAKVMGLRKNSP